MTYLTLCQDSRRECREPSGPSDVTTQIGVLADIVAWVAQSYTELQQERDWRWLRSRFTVNTVSGTDTYAYGDCTDSRLSAVITRFSRWWLKNGDYSNVTLYLTSAGVGGENYLTVIDWEDFRERYKRGSQTNSQPIHITVDPQNNLVLGPKPDAVYTLNGEYQMSPQTLAADGDVPEMPDEYTRIIVGRAMQKYGAARGAAEIFQRGGLEIGPIWKKLLREQLPMVTIDGPLA